MVEIIWTERAVADLDGIASYIALDKPDAARRFVERVFMRVSVLTKHPEMGPRIPELLPQSRFRQLVQPPCRVFYRYDRKQKNVFVLGVMRGEKLFHKRLLIERDIPSPD